MNKGLADIGILAMTSSGTNMFTGTKNSGVFVSTNNGLTNPDVQGLAAKRFKYFCSNSRRRCFVSINNGLNRIHRNQNLDNLDNYSIMVNNNQVFTGTVGCSLWKRSLQEIILIINISNTLPYKYFLCQN